MKTRQALLLAKKNVRVKLDYHRDNNIFEDSPQVYRLQAAVVQHPPAIDDFRRTGTLLSIVPATNAMKRSMAEILATRNSQCECGLVGKKRYGPTYTNQDTMRTKDDSKHGKDLFYGDTRVLHKKRKSTSYAIWIFHYHCWQMHQKTILSSTRFWPERSGVLSRPWRHSFMR